jgi:peptide chain release factor 1
MCVSACSTVFDTDVIEERPGFVAVMVNGSGAKQLFAFESGGHRWQRIPPTERRGRVQTSTVTVAVLDPDGIVGKSLDIRDVECVATRGSGPGGQHRNKTESCIVATHRPTGLQVRIDMRSQHESRRIAFKVLAARLYEGERERVLSQRDGIRREQVGSGMRGDKIRTYRVKDNAVHDHRTGKRWQLDAWERGQW